MFFLDYIEKREENKRDAKRSARAIAMYSVGDLVNGRNNDQQFLVDKLNKLLANYSGLENGLVINIGLPGQSVKFINNQFILMKD